MRKAQDRFDREIETIEAYQEGCKEALVELGRKRNQERRQKLEKLIEMAEILRYPEPPSSKSQ